ncbi:uncharacterized protein LOC115211591 isoform X3 [Octopus sinensis]|nr:uncharacterized protein LOC115211591 isoform X3 [Octopus sinensis]
MPHEKTIKAFLSKPVTLQCHFPGVKVSWESTNNIYLFSYLECRKAFPHVTQNKLFEGVKSNCSRKQKVTFLTLPSITKEHDNIQIKCNRPGSSSHLIFLIKVIKNEIVPHVTTIKAFLSKPVTLQCNFPGVKVSWESTNNIYLFSYLECRKAFPHVTQNKLFEGIKSNCSRRQKVTFLTFPSITKEHDNIQIKCNRPESSSHLIFLIKVINFPTVQVNSVNVKIGEQATLKCNVEDSTNFQIASLKWTQKIFGHQIEGHVSNETQLIFNNTSWRDTGNWTCTIMVTANQKTQIIKGSGILSASGVPIVDHLENVIEAEESQSKTVKCFIYSYSQKIHVEWLHNNHLKEGVILSQSNRQATVVNETVQLPGYIAQLELKNIREKDFGKYTLYVHNKEGVSNATFILRNAVTANNVLIIGITCAVIVLILVTLIICCFWYFSIRKIPSVTEKREYSRIFLSSYSSTKTSSLENYWNNKVLSDSTKLSSIKYIRDFNKDEFISENDEPIYAEIGYIDMDRAKALKATQNEYLSPKSVNSLKRIQNEGTIDRKSTENVYLNPLSVNSLKHAQNEALIG